MRRLVERWRSMSDEEMDRIGENIIAIHWIVLGLALLGWALIPVVQAALSQNVGGRFC